ncbi:MAG: hypothetical protein ABIY70_07165 [Capsulimonas sp.]|uniref:hypothetical protein n=1 Tax=Capsulimonas sp. TaxID=2494211 RepID=UPI00326759A7
MDHTLGVTAMSLWTILGAVLHFTIGAVLGIGVAFLGIWIFCALQPKPTGQIGDIGVFAVYIVGIIIVVGVMALIGGIAGVVLMRRFL